MSLMRFSVSSLRVASAVAAFFEKWSAVVIVTSLWSSQGVKSSGLLFSFMPRHFIFKLYSIIFHYSKNEGL